MEREFEVVVTKRLPGPRRGGTKRAVYTLEVYEHLDVADELLSIDGVAERIDAEIADRMLSRMIRRLTMAQKDGRVRLVTR